MLRIKSLVKVVATAFLLTVMLLAANQQLAQALTTGDVDSIKNNTPFYNPNDTLSGTCSDTAGAGSTTAIVTSKTQDEHAATIIGIAKTDGLGKQGALIGLMAGLAESGLKIYANSNVKVSLSNPAKEATGSDHDSVGIMQQRPSTGWSVIATGTGADNNKDAVWQLMDPAYAAEAFFGSPKGSDAPSALSKGLQNKSGWQQLDPWAAAQAVQGSVYGDGSNYKSAMGAAQTLLDRLWGTSEAVPLPVPFSGGDSGASITGDAANTSGSCNGTSTSTDLGVGKGKFTDDTSITYPDIDKALARAQEIAKMGALWTQICTGNKNGPNCFGLCDHVAAEVWNHSSSGYWTATLHWQGMLAAGYGHPDGRKVPVGALLFYATGHDAGHAAVYLGNNKIGSTDVLDSKSGVKGGYYITDASNLETGAWHLTYLGWSTPVFGDGKFYK